MVVNKEVYVIFGKEQRRTFQKRGKIFFEKRKVLLSGFFTCFRPHMPKSNMNIEQPKTMTKTNITVRSPPLVASVVTILVCMGIKVSGQGVFGLSKM